VRLVEESVRRFGDDPEIQLLRVQSFLLDRKDPAQALTALGNVQIPAGNRGLRIRHGLLMAEALHDAGQNDAAVALLQSLTAEFPTNVRLKQRLDAYRGGPAPTGQ
jgi:hypothetical protein